MAEAADQMVHVSWGQLILTLLSLGGLGWTVYYAHQAFDAADRAAIAGEQSAKAAQEANTKTQTALDLADAANRLSEDTAKRQLRAYVAAGGAGVLDFKSKKTPGGKIRLRNSGQTPAFNVSVVARTRITPIRPVSDETTDMVIEKQIDFTLHPGVERVFHARADAKLDEPTADSIRTGKALVLVLGFIRYKDIFGEPHITRFTHMYSGYPDIEGEYSNKSCGYSDYGNSAD